VSRDRPDLPILLMTGFADQRERADGLETLVREVLAKPFTLDELLAAVGRALKVPEPG
jgi:DNA-binding response OmpR family regulator